MIRALLIILAVLVAILAFILDRTWLYGAAGVPLVVAVGLFARRMWLAYQAPTRPDDRRRSGRPSARGGTRDAGSRDASAREPSSRESLQDLGIMEVRPQQRPPAQDDRPERDAESSPSAASTPDASPSDASTPDADAARGPDASRPAKTPSPRNGAEAPRSSAPEAPDSGATAVADARSASDERPPDTDRARPRPDATAALDVSVRSDPVDAPVVGPFVQSLRAALDAHTVCLLVQEEVALEYRILAIASASEHARSEGRFDTDAPLLTATMTRHPVTVREIEAGAADPRVLGYYRQRVPVDHLALAPVSRPNDPATFFLLADATRETDLRASRAQALLERFADTLGLLLTQHDAISDGSTVFDDVVSNDQTTTASEAAAEEAAQAARDAEKTPRPRSEIIAEEMHDADLERHELALVLVHLNRAESIARRGGDAVASAERLLRIRLEDAAPGSRVTRFGELTYGVFFRGGADQVEPWALDLQDELAEERGELEGGVSVGVAVRGPRHDRPETLRADATRALREAYETGTCTIIE